MSFLAPWFLVGLVALGIPLMIHLRRSRQTTRMVFSTIRFFDDRFIRSARRARLQDRLLMVLRMLLLALLALALARPAMRLPGLNRFFGLAGGKRVVAIVLDDSASMNVTGRGGPLIDRARVAALQALDELSTLKGDEATVVLAGRRDTGVSVLFEQPTRDLEAVRDAIRSAPITDLATDLAGAIRQASETIGATGASAAKGGVSREIFVFSDMQSSGLDEAETLASGPLAGLMFVRLSPEPGAEQDNLSVDAVQYGASRPLIGVPFVFRSLITNHSRQHRSATVRLSVNSQDIARKRVDLPPGRSQIVRFAHRFATAGWAQGFVAVDFEAGDPPDALEADNRRYFALQVSDNVRLLAVNGAPSQLPMNDELFFFRLALTAASMLGADNPSAPAVRIEETDVAGLTVERLRDLPLVLLANVSRLSPAAVQAVEQYVDQGGNLLITLGDRTDKDFYNTLTGEHRLHGGLLPGRLVELRQVAETPEGGGGANFMAAVDNAHPALAGFGDAQLGSLSAVRLSRYYRIESLDAPVLIRDAGDLPLLLEKRFGRGRVMLFASSIDKDWNNFPLQPAFVPWLYRLVGYLSQGGLERAGFVHTGELVRFPSPVTKPAALQITLPGGSIGYPCPDPAAPAGNAATAFAGTEHAGVYAVRASASPAGSGPLMMFAANIPDQESQLDVLDEKNVAPRIAPGTAWVFVSDPESMGRVSRTARYGFGLWDHLLIGALLVALAEPWLANRLSRRKRAPTPGAAAAAGIGSGVRS